ncbi:N-acetyltransferase [Flavobacterium arcticum]|uniref:N-acetyltransferase n=1 Tax=Flavobacterium arcticum TaxID=1784713 RepID=A0A345HE10_9FLAO|nr:GNAT family protein [Flavobacterium arcticum]AXG74820.1 N-acetyltransferase [Flavobacterium arcticum]KAF2509682.1 GNAT family N-acetyltransferase [Flavobacterium arcticum]
MKFKEISTKRLKLRIVTPEVYSYVYDNYDNATIKAFFGIKTDAEVEKERENYNKGVTTYNRSFLHFFLLQPDTDTVIGWCGYHTWYTDHNRAEIGYMLFDDSHKKKGYTSEVLPAVLQYGFDVMKLYRIEAMASPNNAASIKLLDKSGFVKEGYLREHYRNKTTGVMEDSVIYSLLKSEYKL